jgi:hypothetical protein
MWDEEKLMPRQKLNSDNEKFINEWNECRKPQRGRAIRKICGSKSEDR